MTVKEIRSEMKAYRESLGQELRRAKSDQIIDHMIEHFLTENMSYTYCLGFASFGSEVDLWALYDHLWKQERNVYFPLTTKEKITFYPVKSRDEMKPGLWNIYEPGTAKPDYDAALDAVRKSRSKCSIPKTLVIVPGLAFDRAGHRIGYGGGYYDKFLEVHPDVTKVGVAFSGQIQDRIDPMPWDVDLDYIVTEDGLITCGEHRS